VGKFEEEIGWTLLPRSSFVTLVGVGSSRVTRLVDQGGATLAGFSFVFPGLGGVVLGRLRPSSPEPYVYVWGGGFL